MFSIKQPYNFSRSQDLFTDVSWQCFLLFPHIGEVKPIQKYKGHSDKSLFLHTALSLKSTPPSPPLLNNENATEKYYFSNYYGNIN
jgi:hypothetical protein